MQRKSVRVSYREEREKAISAREMTRVELLSYIFSDFIRWSYIVGCLFIDGLIVPSIIQVGPTGLSTSALIGLAYKFKGGFEIYLIAVIVLIEIALIWLEVEGYRYKWPRKARVQS